MPRITDSAMENELRDLDDESPDYAAMRRRIVLEADKRRSGWKESAPGAKRSFRPIRTWSTAAGLLACAAAVGVFLLNPDLLPEPASTPATNSSETLNAYESPAGQALEASAELDGIKLTVNNVIQGHLEDGDALEKRKDRLVLQMNLSGLAGSDADYAGFASTRLTNLDNGQTQELKGAGFDLRSGAADAQDAQVLDGDWPAEGESARYRLETSDLYKIKRQNVPLEGEIREGTEYPIASLDGASLLLLDSQWDADTEQLTLNYELRGSDLENETNYPISVSKEARTQLLLNNGATSIQPFLEGKNGNIVSRTYTLYGMSEQERQSLTMTYSYAENVEKVEGVWRVDFNLDGEAAQERAVSVKPENAAEIETVIGWRLGQASVGAYGVYLPIDRQPQDRVLHDGLVLYYEKSTLLADGYEFAQGAHINQQASREPEAAQGQEALMFELLSEQMRDLTTGPLAIRLQDARIVREAPEGFRTVLADPQQQERDIQAKLPDGSLVHYRYSRQGGDLRVVTETNNRVHLLDTVVLSVNGVEFSPDPDASYEDYRSEGDYRVDVYHNVPQGAEPSIGLDFYSQVDSSLDTKIVLRK
ncbi:hypothetical protein [Saccharibacillus sacchari]|uniref:Uncharacterized protein n=1 Tax=Saccharibacillus sacchari TaxID=456493 RepID=A0ACC6PI31_9BACL